MLLASCSFSIFLLSNVFAPKIEIKIPNVKIKITPKIILTLLNFVFNNSNIFIKANIKIINPKPNKPVLIPENTVKYTPAKTTKIASFHCFFVNSERIIAIDKISTVHKLFPDSK